MARANLEACRHAGTGPLPPVELLEGSWLTPLPGRLQGRVDLVVSNPPYVTKDEWAGLPAEVRAEPRRPWSPGRAGGAPGGWPTSRRCSSRPLSGSGVPGP